MKKNLFTTSLLALLLCLLLPARVMADQAEVDGIWYEFFESVRMAIVVQPQDRQYEGDIAIPPTVEYGGVTYSVMYIGSLAFDRCTFLTSITIPASVTGISDYAFYYCSSLTSISIPASVTDIGYGAFQYCSGLTSITIPKSVERIGGSAFQSCSGMTSVTVKNPTPVTLSSGDVFSNRANATLYVPAGSKAAYEGADYWKEFKAIVEMAPDVPAYP